MSSFWCFDFHQRIRKNTRIVNVREFADAEQWTREKVQMKLSLAERHPESNQNKIIYDDES